MPRKKAEPTTAPTEHVPSVETDDALMMRYFQLKDWVEAETKRFKSHIEPHAHSLEAIENEFLARFNDRKSESSKCDHGTAYKSTLLNLSVSEEGPPFADETGNTFAGREALLEFSLANWTDWGNELLMFNAQKDAVKRYMDEHNGTPPPGIKTSFFTRVNIRRS